MQGGEEREKERRDFGESLKDFNEKRRNEEDFSSPLLSFFFLSVSLGLHLVSRSSVYLSIHLSTLLFSL